MISGTLYAAVAVLGIVDGDSFRARVEVWPGQHVTTIVRVAGIDAPETSGKCASERQKAQAAKLRLAELLTDGQVMLAEVKLDKYASRIDAVVMVDGRNVGDQLLADGMARAYRGGTRAGWCP